MTMPYHIAIGEKISKKKQKKILSLIRQCFEKTDYHYNNWNPSSEISQFNQSKSLEPVNISSELSTLLYLCKQCGEMTDRRFDPTVGSIFQIWRQSLQKNQIPKNPPNEAVGWQNIFLKNLTLQKKHLKCQLDLCGISKGYTIDLMVQKLQELGYDHFFVQWGGEISAKGHHPSGRSWKMQIRIPEAKDLPEKQTLLELKNQSIATSGNFMLHEWRAQKKSYFHIFDPIEKKPVEKKPTFSSVSVIAPNCYLADAIATASMTFDSLENLKLWAQTIAEKNPAISFYIYCDKDKKILRISR